jgi:hypothetical protein
MHLCLVPTFSVFHTPSVEPEVTVHKVKVSPELREIRKKLVEGTQASGLILTLFSYTDKLPFVPIEFHLYSNDGKNEIDAKFDKLEACWDTGCQTTTIQPLCWNYENE